MKWLINLLFHDIERQDWYSRELKDAIERGDTEHIVYLRG